MRTFFHITFLVITGIIAVLGLVLTVLLVMEAVKSPSERTTVMFFLIPWIQSLRMVKNS